MAAAADHVDAYWMPFHGQSRLQERSRASLPVPAEGHHYTTAGRCESSTTCLPDCGRAGVGHCHPKIVAAVQKQVADTRLRDGLPGQQLTSAFALAERVVDDGARGFHPVLSSRTPVQSLSTRALKIALGFHRARGEGHRTRLIGRERGYHGVNFGGMSVGGIVPNRKVFSANLIPGVDHMRATMDLEHTAFSKGQPEWGAHLADDLQSDCRSFP